jgi:hypothetical protein
LRRRRSGRLLAVLGVGEPGRDVRLQARGAAGNLQLHRTPRVMDVVTQDMQSRSLSLCSGSHRFSRSEEAAYTSRRQRLRKSGEPLQARPVRALADRPVLSRWRRTVRSHPSVARSPSGLPAACSAPARHPTGRGPSRRQRGRRRRRRSQIAVPAVQRLGNLADRSPLRAHPALGDAEGWRAQELSMPRRGRDAGSPGPASSA